MFFVPLILSKIFWILSGLFVLFPDVFFDLFADFTDSFFSCFAVVILCVLKAQFFRLFLSFLALPMRLPLRMLARDFCAAAVECK